MAANLLNSKASKKKTSDGNSQPVITWLIVGAIALSLGGAIIYLLWPRVDGKASLDRQITEQWMQGRDVVDALEFFEKGGVYENNESEEAADIDQKYVIPLVKRLIEEHKLQVLAIVEKDAPLSAMAVIAEVPANDRAFRNKVRKTINEEADKFPGFAAQNWSHKYVSIDYFDELEVTPLIQAHALEPLKASQRMPE